LSRLFRGKLLALLRQAFADGRLEFFGQLADLAEPARFHALLRKSKKTEWVVYAKPPFGGPEHVLKYLARYTHRVAIASGRLLSLDNGRVTFRWRDSRHGNRTESMTLDAVEFIRRSPPARMPSSRALSQIWATDSATPGHASRRFWFGRCSPPALGLF
jgi:hypothetical protein